MKNEIVFIIIAYKPDMRILRELIMSIRPYRCVVVNNGGLGTLGMNGVEVIGNGNNLGFGPGANLGINHTKDANPSWFVIVNQDITVKKNAVEKFVLTLMETPAGIAGPVMGSIDPKRWTTILGAKKEKDQYVSGSWFAMHRDVVEKVGLFYEPYFLYYEEVDLCMRSKQKGFTLSHVPLNGFNHDETSSLGKGSFMHEYYLSRNHLLFIERCAPIRVRIYEWLRMPKTMWEYLQTKNTGALSGVRDYIFRRFGHI